MSRGFVLRFALLFTSVVAMATMLTAQSEALFSFHSNAWLNLHLFVRLSARGGPAPTGLSEKENQQWADGLEFHKAYATRDLLMDEGMVAIKTALRGAEGKTTLDGIAIDASLKEMLERLMPIYQKHWGRSTTLATARGSRRRRHCSSGMVLR